MTEAVLEIRNLTKTRGKRRVLDSVDLALNAGQVTAILGPSGAGKSTLLRAIAGLENCDSGTITVDQQELSNGAVIIRPEHRNIGMVFQDFSLFPHLSIIENVMFGLRTGSARSRRERGLEMLHLVHLEDRASDYPHMLSGGEQQRIALARALAPSPSTILLDEAFSGLDSKLRAELRDTALAAIAAQGAAALMVTHDAEEAMYMADTLVLMIDGAIVQSGSPKDLYLHPASARSARLLGEVNEWSGTVIDGEFISPFGRVDAQGQPDGPATLLVRPEGVVATSSASGSCRIRTTHSLGSSIALTIESATAEHWRARVPVEYEWSLDQPVNTSLNPVFCHLVSQ